MLRQNDWKPWRAVLLPDIHGFFHKVIHRNCGSLPSLPVEQWLNPLSHGILQLVVATH